MSLRIRTGVSETVFQYKGKDAHLWLKALERVINADSKEDKHPIAVVNIGDSQDSVTRGTLGKLKHCVKDYAYVVDLERNIARIAEGWKDFKLDFEKYDFKRGVAALRRNFMYPPGDWISFATGTGASDNDGYFDHGSFLPTGYGKYATLWW